MWPGTIPFTVSRTPNPSAARRPYYACGVNGFNIQYPVSEVWYSCRAPALSLCPPATVQVPQTGRRQAQFHAGKKDPGWRMLVGEPAGLIFGQSVARKRLCRGRSQRAKTLRRTVDHSDRNLGCDAPPVLPAVKLRKIVSAHDPDKAQA